MDYNALLQSSAIMHSWESPRRSTISYLCGVEYVRFGKQCMPQLFRRFIERWQHCAERTWAYVTGPPRFWRLRVDFASAISSESELIAHGELPDGVQRLKRRRRLDAAGGVGDANLAV